MPDMQGHGRGVLIQKGARSGLPGLIGRCRSRQPVRVELPDVFTSVADLFRKLMKYIRSYARSTRPFPWKWTEQPRWPALVRRGKGCHRIVCDVMESTEHNAGFAGKSVEDFERRNKSADGDRFRRCG
jgi:hypothetical protein